MMYKPIYVVGYPHGGCTLPCNMLRESKVVYTAVGTKEIRGSSHEDRHGFEGHNSLFNDIPLTLRNPEGRGGQCWSYAWDEHIGKHYLTEKDVTPGDKKQYLAVLEDIKKEFNATDEMRYLDKSQSYLVKTRYVQEMLSPAEVYFLYIIRNPYVVCYKPAKWATYARHEMGVEQVANTYNCFVEDSKHLKHHKIMRFEDFVLKTRGALEEVCRFLELDFEEDMMPHERPDYDHQLKLKFYPLRKEVIDDDGRSRFKGRKLDGAIAERCADIIEHFGYVAP